MYGELKAKRYALKLLANSFYGYFAFYGARWYCLDCAESISYLGRQYIKKIIKEANKFGFKVLYGDTDSLFLEFKGKTEADAKKFTNIVNAFLNYPLRLEFDGLYKKALFVEKKSGEGGAKKKYALLDQNDELILKGLEAVRGDWSAIAREAQTKVIESILKTGSANEAEKYIKKLINNVKNRTISLEKLFLRARLTKPISEYKSISPHVVAAKKAKEKGAIIGAGFSTSYIIGSGEGNFSDRVILAEDAKKEDYSIAYYVDNQILNAVGKIFEAFGYNESELKSGQTKLRGW